jgi:hypothetical protein
MPTEEVKLLADIESIAIVDGVQMDDDYMPLALERMSKGETGNFFVYTGFTDRSADSDGSVLRDSDLRYLYELTQLSHQGGVNTSATVVLARPHAHFNGLAPGSYDEYYVAMQEAAESRDLQVVDLAEIYEQIAPQVDEQIVQLGGHNEKQALNEENGARWNRIRQEQANRFNVGLDEIPEEHVRMSMHLERLLMLGSIISPEVPQSKRPGLYTSANNMRKRLNRSGRGYPHENISIREAKSRKSKEYYWLRQAEAHMAFALDDLDTFQEQVVIPTHVATLRGKGEVAGPGVYITPQGGVPWLNWNEDR